MRILSFDVDGTLKPYGGIIEIEWLQLLRTNNLVGLISNRGDTVTIANKYNLHFGLTGKIGSFNHLNYCLGAIPTKIHIDDDRNIEPICEQFGWQYQHPTEFRWRKYL